MLKKYSPTSAGRRQLVRSRNAQVVKSRPEKSLLVSNFRCKGRSKASGRITTRHKGGGHKKLYRVIDFRREKLNIPARVATFEYDPNRNAYISLVIYKDGEKRYILAPEGLNINEEILSAEKAPLKIGNRMMLKNIPVGTQIHDVEMYPASGGILVRSAGSSATVMAAEGGQAQIKMPSGEIRILKENCFATIGQLSNSEFNAQNFSKAGRKRWMGIRPHVRGTAMNPVDHPHGGGEGRAPRGLRLGPKTPWGKQAFGVKTRRKKKWSSRFIIKRRK